MGEPILQVKDLHYEYGIGKTALNGVSVDIHAGEKIAVIGSNGAGKSTFFLNINGVLGAEDGEILYKGVRITKKNLNELRKNVGIVFQDADSQIIASTVLAEVGFGPMNLKLPREEIIERVDEALAYMNILDYKERPPHYLSGGEKKRVSIADIIAMRPSVMIFDEPTAGLDPLNTRMLEEVLEKLGNEGNTLMISTHDVDFVYRWAERAIVFSGGKIIADTTPLEIFRNEEILEKASLKRPIMFDVYEALVEKKLVRNREIYPKTVVELREILKIDSSYSIEALKRAPVLEDTQSSVLGEIAGG